MDSPTHGGAGSAACSARSSESYMPSPKLILAGLVAAALSAALAIGLQRLLAPESGTPGAPRAVARCVVAARELPAGHKLTESDLEVAESDGRAGGEPLITTRALAIGRMTAVALLKGQAIRPGDLVTPGSGQSIAGQLAPGMRAITVSLRDTGPEVVLFPGALVDMLATLERPARVAGQREPVTLTLLERVRVLAVNDEAVGNKAPAEPSSDRRAASRRLTVTLAVTPEQAAQVELASSRGTIGITLRADDGAAGTGAIGASATARSILGMPDGIADASTTAGNEPPPQPDPSRSPETQSKSAVPGAAAAEQKVWRVTVIRGEMAVTHEVPAAPAGRAQSAPRVPTP